MMTGFPAFRAASYSMSRNVWPLRAVLPSAAPTMSTKTSAAAMFWNTACSTVRPGRFFSDENGPESAEATDGSHGATSRSAPGEF